MGTRCGRRLTPKLAAALVQRFADRVSGWHEESSGFWFDLRAGWEHEFCTQVHIGDVGEPALYADAVAALGSVRSGEPQ